jgi:hypothetical protein
VIWCLYPYIECTCLNCCFTFFFVENRHRHISFLVTLMHQMESFFSAASWSSLVLSSKLYLFASIETSFVAYFFTSKTPFWSFTFLLMAALLQDQFSFIMFHLETGGILVLKASTLLSMCL